MTDFEQTDLASAISGEQPEPVETQPEVTPNPEPAEAPTAPDPVASPAPPADPAPQEAMVPQSVVGSLRAEIRELKAQIPAPVPKAAPDFYEDPQAAVQHQVAPIQQAMVGGKLEMSRFMAEREFGKETVEAAFQYFEQHPEQSGALMGHPSPFHAAVEAFNKNRVASEIGADPDAYKAKIAAEIRAEIEAEMVAKRAQEAAAVAAPSMANVTGTGGGPKATWAGPTSLSSLFGE